jgi:hypothetical protein
MFLTYVTIGLLSWAALALVISIANEAARKCGVSRERRNQLQLVVNAPWLSLTWVYLQGLAFMAGCLGDQERKADLKDWARAVIAVNDNDFERTSSVLTGALTVSAVLAIIASIPTAGVTACELTPSGSACALTDFYPVSINGTVFYTNTTVEFTIGAGEANDGQSLAAFTAAEVNCGTICDGSDPHTPGAVSLGSHVVAYNGEANIPGSWCFGGGLGLGVGSIVSVVAVAVAVRCPGTSFHFDVDTVPATVYSNWNGTTGRYTMIAEGRRKHQLCNLNGCTAFPMLPTGLGRLYIKGGSISDLPLPGSSATVEPPSGGPFRAEITCGNGVCWAPGVSAGDCPEVTQATAVDFSLLRSGAGVPFNPALHTMNTGVFDVDSSSLVADMAQSCNTESVSYTAVETSSFTCQGRGRVTIPECGNRWSTQRAGAPDGYGRLVVAECQSAPSERYVWSYSGQLLPSNGPTTTWTQGAADCESSDGVVVCWPKAQLKPAISWSNYTVTINGYTYYDGAVSSSLCNLTVVSSDASSIVVTTPNDCFTSGCMFTGNKTAGLTRWDVPLNGPCSQLIANGTLIWSFNASQRIPRQRSGNSTNHDYGVPALPVECSGWECSGGNLACLIGESTGWDSCKCSLMGVTTNLGCDILMWIINIVMYALIVSAGIGILVGLYRLVSKTRSNQYTMQ